jgi:hypothetical protein
MHPSKIEHKTSWKQTMVQTIKPFQHIIESEKN